MAPSNPIQKKVRNAALIGSLATLVLMSIVVGFLLWQLNIVKKEQEKMEASYVSVYTLGQDIKSGQVITEDMLVMSTAQIDHIPNNATSNLEIFTNYSLTDNEGNRVYSDEKGMFLTKNSEYIEIYKEGNKYYTYSNQGQKQEVTGLDARNVYEDTYGAYAIKTTEGKARLYTDDMTGKYYILRVKYNTNSEGTPVREKEYIEISGVPLLAKIDMNMNTVLTLDMISRGSLTGDDVRVQDYNSIVLPIDLVTGDYVDIRLQLPSGQDYIVLSKKEVEIPIIEGMDSVDTIRLLLSEDEMLTLSCAIVESYRIDGSKLYAIKYTDAGMQEAAAITYPVSAEILSLIQADPNVTEIAEQKLKERYTEALVNIRNNVINKELQKEENSAANAIPQINESIVKTQEDRQKYLESLGGSFAE